MIADFNAAKIDVMKIKDVTWKPELNFKTFFSNLN